MRSFTIHIDWFETTYITNSKQIIGRYKTKVTWDKKGRTNQGADAIKRQYNKKINLILTFIHLHSFSTTFINFHPLLSIFIHFQPHPFASVHFHPPTLVNCPTRWSLLHLRSPTSSCVHLQPASTSGSDKLCIVQVWHTSNWRTLFFCCCRNAQNSLFFCLKKLNFRKS